MRGERAINELAQLAWELGYTLESMTLRAPIRSNMLGPFTAVRHYETDFNTVTIIKEVG